jgi:hypothetical protein
MKIAQVILGSEQTGAAIAPPMRQVVAMLTSELNQRGHRVEVWFGEVQGGSPSSPIVLPWNDADLVHVHTDALVQVASRTVPALVTVHGHRLASPHANATPAVAVSKVQRRRHDWLRWVTTIHYGLPSVWSEIAPSPAPYLVCVGPLRLACACSIARLASEAGLPLHVIANGTHGADVSNGARAALCNHGRVHTNLGPEQRAALISGALALVVTGLDLACGPWPILEALACGTPIIDLQGAAEEFVEPGVTGYAPRGWSESIEAIQSAHQMDRSDCRAVARERYSIGRMIDAHLDVYERYIGRPRYEDAPVAAAG